MAVSILPKASKAGERKHYTIEAFVSGIDACQSFMHGPAQRMKFDCDRFAIVWQCARQEVTDIDLPAQRR